MGIPDFSINSIVRGLSQAAADTAVSTAKSKAEALTTWTDEHLLRHCRRDTLIAALLILSVLNIGAISLAASYHWIVVASGALLAACFLEYLPFAVDFINGVAHYVQKMESGDLANAKYALVGVVGTVLGLCLGGLDVQMLLQGLAVVGFGCSWRLTSSPSALELQGKIFGFGACLAMAVGILPRLVGAIWLIRLATLGFIMTAIVLWPKDKTSQLPLLPPGPLDGVIDLYHLGENLFNLVVGRIAALHAWAQRGGLSPT